MSKGEIILLTWMIIGSGLLIYAIQRDWITFLAFLGGIIFIDLALSLGKRLQIIDKK